MGLAPRRPDASRVVVRARNHRKAESARANPETGTRACTLGRASGEAVSLSAPLPLGGAHALGAGSVHEVPQLAPCGRLFPPLRRAGSKPRPARFRNYPLRSPPRPCGAGLGGRCVPRFRSQAFCVCRALLDGTGENVSVGVAGALMYHRNFASRNRLSLMPVALPYLETRGTRYKVRIFYVPPIFRPPSRPPTDAAVLPVGVLTSARRYTRSSVPLAGFARSSIQPGSLRVFTGAWGIHGVLW